MTRRFRISLNVTAILVSLAAHVACDASDARAAAPQVHMATGIKIGEVDHDSAIVWTRLTRHAERNAGGKPFDQDDGKDGKGLEDLDARRGSAPGASGEVRVAYWLTSAPDQRIATEWLAVDDKADYTRQLHLEDLAAGAHYALLVEGRADASDDSPCRLEGGFHTAPAPDAAARVTFTVVTGQDYHRREDKANGHKIYPVMRKLDPDFFIHTGDIVYFDRLRPFATNLAAARFKWNRIDALPFQRDFHNQVASYFMKDDHDTLRDDCWPGQRYGDLTFEQGKRLFLEQVPMGEKTYRTVRWGKDLQIWLVEGRDFRSPNPAPDGPDKTIWGAEQKKWFFDTVKASDATFRILVSPTPMVGPDKERKRDNHANPNFTHEGNELRAFIARQKNMFFICGDRHWQYVSVDPVSGLREYSCGPTADSHAQGFTEDQRTSQHEYLRIKGGFLSGEVDRKPGGVPVLTLRHHGVDGKVYHEDVHSAYAPRGT